MRDVREPGGGQGEDTHVPMEISSYRRVFALERRLYRIEGVRLNPAGVPLRSVVCFLALACAGFLLGRLPLTGVVVGVVPWYLRETVAPALATFVLTCVRIEGRPFHLAALALLRWRLGPRRLVLAGQRRAAR